MDEVLVDLYCLSAWLRVIANPTDNPNAGGTAIFQLQLNLTW